MECEEAINLISAQMDGELSSDDLAALEAHLGGCADCRATAEAMQFQDAQLVRAFAPRRHAAESVAERVIAHLPASSAEKRPARRVGWAPMLSSAAAGFLIALMLFRPWERREQPTGSRSTSIVMDTQPSTTRAVVIAAEPSVARLTIATGEVDVIPIGKTDWEPMTTGASIPAGVKVRTGPKVRCEFAMADGSQLRLNEQTEMQIRSTRELALAAGQVWSSVAKQDKPFQVAFADATVTTLGTEFDLAHHSNQTTLTVFDGSTRFRNSRGEKIVRSGQALHILNGTASEPQRAWDLALASSWADEILVRKGHDNQELTRRIDDLFAEIGKTKLENLYEYEIRALGDHACLPLARYIQSDRSRGEDFKRHKAAKILSDIAPTWAIPDLVDLLEDRDGEVRVYAAMALNRLTGETMDRDPEQWRQAAGPANREALAQWRAWWEKNGDRYRVADPRRPGAVPTAPAPIEKATAIQKS